MKQFIAFFILFVAAGSAQSLYDNDKLNDLTKMNLISVTIGGDFIVTGSFPAAITERVDQFITRLYTEAAEKTLSTLTTKPELVRKARKELDNYTLRNITLKRSNGEEIKIDLLKFRRTGDFSLNPYLKNDDVLIFAPSDPELNFITVDGAVNRPGKFDYVKGDRLADAIELAFGVNEAYEDVTEVNIYRLSYDGQTTDILTIDITDNILLERGDRIIVLADEPQRKSYSVTVIGEVNKPGTIPITKNNTTLKEVLQRVGGIKETASLNRSRLYTGNTLPLLLQKEYGINLKEEYSEIEVEINQAFLKQENYMMYRMSDVVPEDSTYFFIENQLRVFNEGSAVDFTKLNDQNSDAGNYIVNDGDIIIIPSKPTTVQVFGQVPFPGHINFIEGKDYEYYIEKAGGYGEYAEDGDVMIIKGASRNWIPADESIGIEAGDYLWIPRTPARSFNYYVREVGQYLSIVASAATVILLLIEFSR